LESAISRNEPDETTAEQETGKQGRTTHRIRKSTSCHTWWYMTPWLPPIDASTQSEGELPTCVSSLTLPGPMHPYTPQEPFADGSSYQGSSLSLSASGCFLPPQQGATGQNAQSLSEYPVRETMESYKACLDAHTMTAGSQVTGWKQVSPGAAGTVRAFARGANACCPADRSGCEAGEGEESRG
jgi:hypothetical protein